MMRTTLRLRIAAATATIALIAAAGGSAAVYVASGKVEAPWLLAGLLFALTAGVLACSCWLGGVLTRGLSDFGRRIADIAPDRPHEPLAVAGQVEEIAVLARSL